MASKKSLSHLLVVAALAAGCAKNEATRSAETPAQSTRAMPPADSPTGAPGDNRVPGSTHETQPESTHAPDHASSHAHGHAGDHAEGHAHRHAGDHAQGDADAHAQGHRKHGAGYQMDFSEVERFAAHFDDPTRDAWQRPKEVVQLMNITPGQTVVDLGAGTGYFLKPLSEAVGPQGKVLALDVEANMVRYMERRARKAGLSNVEPATVKPDDPGLVPASVDRVLIVNTWHHIGQRSAYAEKLASALKPGGTITVVDFTKESDIGPPVGHRLTAQEVIEELKRAGLDAEVVDEQLPKQYAVRAKAAQ